MQVLQTSPQIIGFTGTIGCKNSILKDEQVLIDKLGFRVYAKDKAKLEIHKSIKDLTALDSVLSHSAVLIYCEEKDIGTYRNQMKNKLRCFVDEAVEDAVKEKLVPGDLCLVSKPMYMRGYDYRSKKIFLVIAKSFANQREAQQGLGRVGRFDDECVRLLKDGVDLVNLTEECKHWGALGIKIKDIGLL
jgi:hypothetical protein